MTFQVEITPIAEAQIEKAYCWYRERNPEFADRWFRGLMNTVATLQENPLRCIVCSPQRSSTAHNRRHNRV
jgi:plasmid stabilization system protein ParE